MTRTPHETSCIHQIHLYLRLLHLHPLTYLQQRHSPYLERIDIGEGLQYLFDSSLATISIIFLFPSLRLLCGPTIRLPYMHVQYCISFLQPYF